MCRWPITSASVRGRSRSARGAWVLGAGTAFRAA
jgi:hypothetical protein